MKEVMTTPMVMEEEEEEVMTTLMEVEVTERKEMVQ